MPEPGIEQGRRTEEISLLDVLTILVGHRRFILLFVAACTVVMAIVSLVVPQVYTAKVSILPPEKNERSGLSSLLSSASASMLDFSPLSENRSSDYFLDVLRSRTMMDSLFSDYPDVRAYFAGITDLRADQAELFTGAVSSDAGRDGMVTSTVQLSTGMMPSSAENARTAKLSAQIASGLARELDKLNRLKLVSRAHNARVYIEEQIHRVKGQLDSLYGTLTAFQREHKVLALEKQVESEVKSAAELQSKIMELEYQMRFRLRSQTPSNYETQQLRERLAALKEQYAQLQGGGDSTDYFLAFPQIPALQKDYANMVRDLKALEQVYAYLQTQYFQERVQEERDTPTVQVLDEPQVPERRTAPKRTLWVLLTLLFSTLGACVGVVARDVFVGRILKPAERERMDRLIESLPIKIRRRKTPVTAGDASPGAAPRGGPPPMNGDRR